jgi:hypothetical protein
MLKDWHIPKSDENDYRSPDMQNSYMQSRTPVRLPRSVQRAIWLE